ncbi:hypothetical protein L210DRAFT_3634196 [Boletus edulis BED1]|uniref:Uncharacterized protein n=1 Tax=Boletus edulis BED1 TaxID=1328754 RepID=A0AAD4BH73_BOLED|nr:hypothetical protein L210DRAFT_3634196 [Boletus edulis BED1]
MVSIAFGQINGLLGFDEYDHRQMEGLGRNASISVERGSISRQLSGRRTDAERDASEMLGYQTLRLRVATRKDFAAKPGFRLRMSHCCELMVSDTPLPDYLDAQPTLSVLESSFRPQLVGREEMNVNDRPSRAEGHERSGSTAMRRVDQFRPITTERPIFRTPPHLTRGGARGRVFFAKVVECLGGRGEVCVCATRLFDRSGGVRMWGGCVERAVGHVDMLGGSRSGGGAANQSSGSGEVQAKDERIERAIRLVSREGFRQQVQKRRWYSKQVNGLVDASRGV